jgi:hypothetical protein
MTKFTLTNIEGIFSAHFVRFLEVELRDGENIFCGHLAKEEVYSYLEEGLQVFLM